MNRKNNQSTKSLLIKEIFLDAQQSPIKQNFKNKQNKNIDNLQYLQQKNNLDVGNDLFKSNQMVRLKSVEELLIKKKKGINFEGTNKQKSINILCQKQENYRNIASTKQIFLFDNNCKSQEFTYDLRKDTKIKMSFHNNNQSQRTKASSIQKYLKSNSSKSTKKHKITVISHSNSLLKPSKHSNCPSAQIINLKDKVQELSLKNNSVVHQPFRQSPKKIEQIRISNDKFTKYRLNKLHLQSFSNHQTRQLILSYRPLKTTKEIKKLHQKTDYNQPKDKIKVKLLKKPTQKFIS